MPEGGAEAMPDASFQFSAALIAEGEWCFCRDELAEHRAVERMPCFALHWLQAHHLQISAAEKIFE